MTLTRFIREPFVHFLALGALVFAFNAGGVTPAMAVTKAGAGSDYALAYLDANKSPRDGSKTYKVTSRRMSR